MNRSHSLPITSLVLVVALPFAWFACGGGKPAESPSNDTSSSSEESSNADASAPPAAASSSAAPAAEAPTATASATATETATAAPAPPPPSFGSTDCGACVAKTCAKPEKACGKNSDCQTMLDGVHSCTSGGESCIDGATAPASGKPKTLAGAYTACAKKAISKACKAKCQ